MVNTLFLLFALLIIGTQFTVAQTLHYLHFTPRSINLPFLVNPTDSRTIISSFFEPYPAIGYGFMKEDFAFSTAAWIELPVYTTENVLSIKGSRNIERYEIRSGIKILFEIEGAYTIDIKDWILFNLGLTFMSVFATYTGNIYYSSQLTGNISLDKTFRQRVLYTGLPIRTGITMFPIRKLAVGLSIDLLWHVIYKISYTETVSIYYTTAPPDPKPLKPYIPEIRFRLHVTFLKTNGHKSPEGTYNNG